MFGRLDIDRFATYVNKLLPKFNSFFFEKDTCGVDAFAQDDWNLYLNYLNPPFPILGRVTNFLQYNEPNAKFILIAPYWVGSPWYGRLASLCDHIFLLPTDKLFV